MTTATHLVPTDPGLASTGEIAPPEGGHQRRACEAVPGPAGNAPQEAASADADHRLQDILPELKDLAQRVGGFHNLVELLNTLDTTKM